MSFNQLSCHSQRRTCGSCGDELVTFLCQCGMEYRGRRRLAWCIPLFGVVLLLLHKRGLSDSLFWLPSSQTADDGAHSIRESLDITARGLDPVFVTSDPLANTNFGIKQDRTRKTATGGESILNNDSAAETLLGGHRVLFLGTSFVQRIANEWFHALGVEPDFRAAVLVNPSKHFTVRRIFDGAVFSATGESIGSAQYRAALLKADGSRQEAARHDIIIIARASWDLAFFNTHPKDFADSLLEALLELRQKWLTPDGRLVIYQHHSLRQKKVTHCLNPSRLQLIRLATFSALRKFLRITGLQLSDGRNTVAGKQSVVVFDIYNVTAKDPKGAISNDGHHLNPLYTKCAAESLLLQLLFKGTSFSSLKLSHVTRSMLSDGFLRSLPQSIHAELEDFDKTARGDIPYNDLRCMCGKSKSGVHPACRMGWTWFSWERRYLTVQHYLKKAYNGMSEMQVRELVSIICEDQSPRASMNLRVHEKFTRCLDNMGATPEMSLDPKVPLQPRRDASSDSICLCVNETTDVTGRANPRCADVAERWTDVRRTCPFMVADAPASSRR